MISLGIAVEIHTLPWVTPSVKPLQVYVGKLGLTDSKDSTVSTYLKYGC